MSEKSKIITAILVTAIIIYMAIALSGCSSVPREPVEEIKYQGCSELSEHPCEEAFDLGWCEGFHYGYHARIKEERGEL